MKKTSMLAIAMGLFVQAATAQISVRVSADGGSGACPAQVNFRAEVTVSGPSSLQYQWRRSDGATAAPQDVKFPQAGTYPITTSWQLGAAYKGWMSLAVIRPDKIESNQAPFEVTCRAGASVVIAPSNVIAPSIQAAPVLAAPPAKSLPPAATYLSPDLNAPKAASPLLLGTLVPLGGKRLADGNYPLSIRGYETQAGGKPLWEKRLDAVAVRNNKFTVSLDQGSAGSPGATAPYLELQIGGATPSARVASTSVAPAATSAFSFGTRQTANFAIDPASAGQPRVRAVRVQTEGVGEIATRFRVGDSPSAVAVSGDLAYVGSNSGPDAILYVVDVRNPRSPAIRSSVRITPASDPRPVESSAVTVSGGFAYVSLRRPNANPWLAIVDIHDASSPQLLSTTEVAGFASSGPNWSLPVLGNHLAFCGALFDVADPRAPVLEARVPTGCATQVMFEIVRGDEYPPALREHSIYLVFGNSSGAVVTWNVTNFRRPMQTSSVVLADSRPASPDFRPPPLLDFRVLNNRLYISNEVGLVWTLTPNSIPRIEHRTDEVLNYPRFLGADADGFIYALAQENEMVTRMDFRDIHRPVLQDIDIGGSDGASRGNNFGVLSGNYGYIVNPTRGEFTIVRLR